MPRTLQSKSLLKKKSITGLRWLTKIKMNQKQCDPVLSIREDETFSFQASVRTLKPGSCSRAPKAPEKEIEFNLAL